jgi:hypothetical protein
MGILTRTIFIIALITLTSFSSQFIALASEEVTITGIWDGSTVLIPIELNKGDRIIGDMLIAENSMYVRLLSSSGEAIAEGIDVISFHIDYTAENSETISFAIMFLFGTGNPEYYLTYTIYLAGDIQPPLVTTTPTPTTAPPSDSTEIPPWIWSSGGGFVAIILLIVIVVIRNRAMKKKAYDKGSEDTAIDVEVGDTSLIENFPKECKRCKGTGKIKRGVMPIQRGGKIEMKEVYYGCLICGGTGWIME